MLLQGNMSDAAEAEVLEQECHMIHFQLFGFNAPNEIVKRYIDAQKKMFADQTERLPLIVLKIIKGNFDIEAIEFYWRLRKLSPILQQKLSVLLFLVESQGQYVESFYQFESGITKAFCELTYYFFRSIYLFLKGFILSAWLKLV